MNHLLSENKVVRPKKVEYFKGEKEKQMQYFKKMCKPKQKSISLQLRYLSFQHI